MGSAVAFLAFVQPCAVSVGYSRLCNHVGKILSTLTFFARVTQSSSQDEAGEQHLAPTLPGIKVEHRSFRAHLLGVCATSTQDCRKKATQEEVCQACGKHAAWTGAAAAPGLGGCPP